MAQSFDHDYLVWELQLGESDCTPAQEQHFRTHPFLLVDPSNPTQLSGIFLHAGIAWHSTLCEDAVKESCYS